MVSITVENLLEKYRLLGEAEECTKKIEELLNSVDQKMSEMKQSTKQCPKCGDVTIPLNSTDEKICATCGYVIEWKLEKGQERTFKEARGGEL